MMEAQRERRTPLRCATHKHRQEHWPVLGGARVTLMLQRARRRHDRHRKRASRGSQLGVAAANCGSSRFATPGHDSPKASRCPTLLATKTWGMAGRSRASRCTILLEAASKPALPCAQPAQPLPRTRAAMPDPPPHELRPERHHLQQYGEGRRLAHIALLSFTPSPTHPPSGSHSRRSSARAPRIQTRATQRPPSTSAWASPTPRRCSTSSRTRPP